MFSQTLLIRLSFISNPRNPEGNNRLQIYSMRRASNILYSKKFADGNIFRKSRISTFRTDFIFVQCWMLNARVGMRYAWIVHSVRSFTGTNFSTELILVQKRPCTKSYENKFRPKVSCYTVTGVQLSGSLALAYQYPEIVLWKMDACR